jgi:hypothetical protein
MLRVYTAHYNHERPHRGLAPLTPEIGDAAGLPTTEKTDRRDRLGGLIHEYTRAAWRMDLRTRQRCERPLYRNQAAHIRPG